MTEQNENVSSRQPGRPSQGEEPDVAWDQVDHLLVHGESLEEEESSLGCINYPSYPDLAERFGVSKSHISKYSQEHNCMQRRKYEHAKTNKQVLAQGELQQLLETQKPLNKKKLLLITDYLIRDFRDALQDGRMHIDTISDFLQIMKLREKLTGNDEQDATHPYGLPTLEELQKKHAEDLKRREDMMPEMLCMVDSQSQDETEDDDEEMN